MQPLKGIAGVIGLVVLSIEVTDRRNRQEQEILDIAGRERRGIGRDLHDGLGQELTGAALMLRGLPAGCRSASSKRRKPRIQEITEVVNRSIENARCSLARGLPWCATPAPPRRCKNSPRVAVICTLLEVDVLLEVSPEVHFSEPEANHLYRIAQEALTNAARHGRASRVEIALSAARHAFLLCVSDDGEGMAEDAAPYTGMGLNIMKYRAGMIGAKFEIVSRKLRGTVVRVTGEQSPTAAPSRPSSILSGVNVDACQ